jgi:hypothetical protein
MRGVLRKNRQVVLEQNSQGDAAASSLMDWDFHFGKGTVNQRTVGVTTHFKRPPARFAYVIIAIRRASRLRSTMNRLMPFPVAKTGWHLGMICCWRSKKPRSLRPGHRPTQVNWHLGMPGQDSLGAVLGPLPRNHGENLRRNRRRGGVQHHTFREHLDLCFRIYRHCQFEC